jgi:ribonuclease-3
VTTADPTETQSISALERRIKLRFRDRDVLRLALSHTSFVNERPGESAGSNERLEFLGDAIVGAVISDWLYRSHPDISEGDLTVIRSTLVREETLARWAREIDLGSHLLLGRGEALGGGRGRSTLLSRAFEALVGAIFLEKGDRAVRKFLWPFFESEMASHSAEQPLLDSKSRLQHLSQVQFNRVPRYRVVGMGGPEHEPIFTCEVFILPELTFLGNGRTKRLAEQDAARLAIAALSLSEDDEAC